MQIKSIIRRNWASFIDNFRPKLALRRYHSADHMAHPGIDLILNKEDLKLSLRVSPQFPLLLPLTLEEENQIEQALTFAYDRSWRKFFFDPSSDFSLGDKLIEQNVDIFLVITKSGVLWLASFLFFKNLIHIQSPLLSYFAHNSDPNASHFSKWTFPSPQIDHSTWSWGKTKKLQKLHLTPVRDSQSDGLFRQIDIPHLKSQSVINVQQDRSSPILKQNNELPTQLCLFSLSGKDLIHSIDLTRNLQIGGSLPTQREQKIISTPLSATDLDQAKKIAKTCQLIFRNRVHLLDIRNSKIFSDPNQIFEMCFSFGPTDSHNDEQAKTISFASPPIKGQSCSNLFKGGIQNIPENMEIEIRFLQTGKGPNFENEPLPAKIVLFTESSQPAMPFSWPEPS